MEDSDDGAPGGAGFLGSNVVDALLAAGDKVVVYDDLSTGSKKNVLDWNPKDVKVVEGDVRDAKALAKVAKGCDYLLHFAAVTGVQIHGRVRRQLRNLLHGIGDAGGLEFVLEQRDQVGGGAHGRRDSGKSIASRYHEWRQ